jgi:hypothetical protein
MQDAAAALDEAAVGGCGVSLCKLGLEMLVDQEQSPYGTAQVTIAARDNFVDCSVVRSEAH